MAKRTDIKKILIIGSGPIVIGQAAVCSEDSEIRKTGCNCTGNWRTDWAESCNAAGEERRFKGMWC